MDPLETLIRSNERNLVQKDANEAYSNYSRVVINTPHPEPELIDVLPFKCNHKFSDNKCSHKSSKDKCNHQSRSEGSGNLLEAS